MSFIRPDAASALLRWRDVAIGLALALLGLWILMRGGYFYGALGLVALGLGAGLALAAWRRLRFAQPVSDPGLVEIDEGRISWFGPESGGSVALSELARIELCLAGGHRVWRLVEIEGTGLDIPAAASGAEALFDVFAALPGARLGDFLAAQTAAAPRVVWRRAPPHNRDALARP